jgi:hypothetical protein
MRSSSPSEARPRPRERDRRRFAPAAVTLAAVLLGGCAWTPGGKALTVDEYRQLEERWAAEHERRVEALLDERFETLRDHGERLEVIERRTQGMLVGLRELEAAQQRAIRETRAGEGASAADGDDAGGKEGARDNTDASGGESDGADDGNESAGGDGLDLGREPDVLASGEPLVFGKQECIGLPEQGLVLRARIDSGANTASLGAIDITEFERDGDTWVRFRIPNKGLGEEALASLENGGQPGGGAEEDGEDVFDEVLDVIEDAGEAENEEEVGVVVESEVYRRVTIIQASGEEERYVVRLPTRIGPLDQQVEYTLTDRRRMTYTVLLGRRMLKDLAVIDVARDFVQPCPPR